MGHVFEMLALPHITDRSTRAYYKNLDWGTAEPEEPAHAFSLLVKLPKSSRNKVFHRHMRDSDFETLPRQLSAGSTIYYNRKHKEKDKTLVQMHTNFTPVLQVLYHTALDCFQTPIDGLTTEQLLEECHLSSEDLWTMLLEYFGKHIVQPRRDLFEKDTKMKVSEPSDTGFLTQVDASAAMETCKQIELF